MEKDANGRKMGEVPQDSEDIENHGAGSGRPVGMRKTMVVKLLCEQHRRSVVKP